MDVCFNVPLQPMMTHRTSLVMGLNPYVCVACESSSTPVAIMLAKDQGVLIMGVRSYPPRIAPMECLKEYSIPCQLIEPACLVALLDLAWDFTMQLQELLTLMGSLAVGCPVKMHM